MDFFTVIVIEFNKIVLLGALLKAAFICAEVVDMKSKKSLREQLKNRYGGGFEIQSWSNLPHGSGEFTKLWNECYSQIAISTSSGKYITQNCIRRYHLQVVGLAIGRK